MEIEKKQKEIRNPALVIYQILEVVPTDSNISNELEIFKKKWNTNFRYTPPEFMNDRFIECFYHLALLLSEYMTECDDAIQNKVESIIKNKQ